MSHSANVKNSAWKLTPETGKSKKRVYSEDELIDAYLKGIQDQKNREKQVLFEKLKSNLELAQSLSEELYAKIKKHGFNCSSIKLKIKDFTTFVSLFVINEDDYCNDKFLKIYDESIKIKKEKLSPTFDFRIIFTPENKNFSEECLTIDGFYHTYASK